MTYYPIIAYTLGALTVFALVISAVLISALSLSAGRAALRAALGDGVYHPIIWAWLVSLTAMSGSLFFSAGAGFITCHLCWYQRIAMYPLVFVLGVGALKRDPDVWRFALPLPFIGFVISAYHVALQFQPAIELVACDEGAPCSARYVAVFGFVSIPVMAGAAFLLIAALLLTVRTVQHSDSTD